MINLDRYRKRDFFFLWEVVFLWFDYEPDKEKLTSDSPPSGVLALSDALPKLIQPVNKIEDFVVQLAPEYLQKFSNSNSELISVPEYPHFYADRWLPDSDDWIPNTSNCQSEKFTIRKATNWMNYVFRKNDLILFAGKRDQRPPFLYPETRLNLTEWNFLRSLYSKPETNELTEEEFKKFLGMEKWSDEVAVYLLSGVRPGTSKYDMTSYQRDNYYKIQRKLKEDARLGLITPVSEREHIQRVIDITSKTKGPIDKKIIIMDFSPIQVINWAQENEFDIPEPLLPLLNHKTNLPSLPPYLNPNHKHYAHELDLAVRCWMDLYDGEKIKSWISYNTQAEEWVEKNAGKIQLSKGAPSRIATLINPDQNREKRGQLKKRK